MTALNDAEDVISNLPYGLICALYDLRKKYSLDDIINAAESMRVVDRDLMGSVTVDDVVRSDDRRFYWYRVSYDNTLYFVESDGSLGMDDINDCVKKCATAGKQKVVHKGRLWHRVRSERDSTWPTGFPTACGAPLDDPQAEFQHVTMDDPEWED